MTNLVPQPNFTIDLPVFKGPFDLLLFFIERDELDIYNIPIATITDDFLDYIHKLEALNIDLASEFIVVAATLMRIKAKLLLPRKPIDDEGNEIDPRQELVDRLLEYKRYKSVLEELRRMEEMRSYMTPRGNAAEELRKLADYALAESEIESITLFKLMKAFNKIMMRYDESTKKREVHKVYDYPYTIQGQQDFILARFEPGKKVDFESVFEKLENRVHAIVTFLAMLELLNLQLLELIMGEGYNNFWLELPTEPKEIDLDELDSPTDVQVEET
jgi:segregation and condensation protein A